jgi:hypothetical protein
MWNDPEPLIGILDSQFALLFDAKEQRQLLLLPKLLSLLEREPVLLSLFVDLRGEAESVLDDHRKCCERIRLFLRELWLQHGSELTSRLAKDKERGEIDAYWPLDRYEVGLQTADELSFPEDGPVRDDVPGDETGKLLRAMRHWVTWCRQTGYEVAWLDNAASELATRLQEHQRAVRHVQLATEGFGWCAFVRLQALVARLNPEAHDMVRLYAYQEYRSVAFGSKSLFQARDSDGGRRVAWALNVIANDARLLHEELRVRLLRGLSRRSVLARYAARCEAFRATELRKLAERRGHREAPLTVDLASYLFDCGFTPIIDPTIGQLRPDVVDTSKGSLFYVEAKQYDRSPRQKLEAAYKQVWSTWMRLEKQYSLPEGFLVVFRRGGALVDLPSQLDFAGRRLYSILVDISQAAGSGEQSTPIRLDLDRLLPAATGQRRPGSASPVAAAARSRRSQIGRQAK